jgi:branched-chain amino acid transport system permease protein
VVRGRLLTSLSRSQVAAYFVQLLSGLSYASTLFLVAAGLSIIFGVTRIVNFAHGSFYMLGAYLAYTLSGLFKPVVGGAFGFWGGVLAAALVVGLVGLIAEIVILRRIYRAPELFQLLATFGIVLIVQDAVLAIWGREDLLAPRVQGLRGTIDLFGERFPQYHLVLILLGPVVLGLLWLLFRRTRWGVLVRAATQDREMAAALGVNQRVLFSTVFFLGSFLAGLGGALQIPKEAANLQMDMSIIAETFVVVVIGGMGSVAGAFLAALLIGEIHAFGILIFPQITLVLVFLVMAVVLVVRPYGLLGRAESLPRGGTSSADAPLRRAGPRLLVLGGFAFVFFALLPPLLGDYARVIASEVLILMVFAASLHFIMHIGGLVSFGHAAYFGLGAYGAALLVHDYGWPMGLALIAAPVVAALGALLFGWFCIRLSGVYLAMLTLAFAQIVWSVAFQSHWTGGDNGVLGVWPTGWLRDKRVYYYFVLALCTASLLLIRRLVFSPFGYALRAGRDSPVRAEAIGIDVRQQQWLSFALAGAFSGLAGALFAFHNGSVFPGVLAIAQSVDGLVMVLLGGLQTLMGPIVGAGVFHLLKTELVRSTEYWRLVLGVVIVLIVIVFPQGIVGFARARWGRRGTA